MAKRKKKQPENTLDFELNFNDVTILEANGKYERIKKLIESEFPYPTDWNIHSNLTILSHFGEGSFALNFRWDKSLYIIDYRGSTESNYNVDIRCLTRWSQDAGWGIPQPTESLVRSALSFWKHQWETLLVDSTFLDKKYGIRKSLDMRTQDMSDRMEAMEDDEFVDEVIDE